MNGKQHKCEECRRKVKYWVLVPWVHIRTNQKGEDWVPFCEIHKPNAENWKTKLDN